MLGNAFLTRRDRPFSTPQRKVGTCEPCIELDEDDIGLPEPSVFPAVLRIRGANSQLTHLSVEKIV